MGITKCLTISTAHIRQFTRDLLDKEIKKTTIEGIVVYAKEDYGWFIYLYPEMDHFAATAPADLKACIDLAIKNDCQMLCLDSDAEILDCLPHYTEADLTSVQAEESFPAGRKPEWLTMEDIEGYESRMNRTLLFSEVELFAGGYSVVFLAGGIVRDADDLYGNPDYQEFIEDLDAEECKAHVEVHIFGTGETVAASDSEIREIRNLKWLNGSLFFDHCERIEDIDFTFLVDIDNKDEED